MLTYRTGVAGSAAGGKAIAKYLTSETLRPENDALARYYAGETIPEHELTGMDHVARAILDGDVGYAEVLDDLVRAHMRVFGLPDDIDGLLQRIGDQLLRSVDNIEARKAIAAEGGTVARIRADLNPRLAQRLGIDANRPPTQNEIANLLAGLRADGQPIEGKQVQKPIRSVGEVFGLDEKVLPSAEAVERVLAGRRADGEAPTGSKGAELPDTVVRGARRRFLAAYGLPSGQEPTEDQVAHMKAGRTVNGLDGNAGDILWALNATKQPIAFVDMVWKADKSVSVAWALAHTEAERSIIRQAHDDAVAFAMTYVEDQLGYVRRGKKGIGGVQRGTLTYMTFNHYTARPTAEIARTDEEGLAYTEFADVPMRHADPLIHTHAPMLNAVLTADGHIGSMDLDRLDGLVKELGGVYQARLAQNLRAHGIETVLDRETGSARVVAIPERVRRHFSKRSQDGQEAARAYAREQGLDWDTLSAERKSAMLHRGVEETRHAKAKRDGDNDFAEWRRQAIQELGYHHRSVLRPDELKPELTPERRQQRAYEISLDLIEKALSHNAKLGAQEFRAFAVRGLVEAGIGDDPAADIKAIMRMYRDHGVRQDGRIVPIIFGKDVPLRGKERWSVTTELHAAREQRVIDLARWFSNDTSRSLSPVSIERAQRQFLVAHPAIDPQDRHWLKQAEVSHKLATGGRLGIAVGVAGAGKSTLISPVVAAAKAEEREVFGIGRGWKQATSLREAGVDAQNVAAVAAFLKRARDGRIQLDDRSIVVLEELSQVGRGDMLKLLELQQRHGFTMLAIGDPKQGRSIDPEVIDLLVNVLGNKVPQILSSVRQRVERDREIAAKFRNGAADTIEAIRMKREDGTAELVAGGREKTIERVADLWRERMMARGDDADFRISISAPTNRDAHAIGVAVRERMRAIGQLGPDLFDVSVALRGERQKQKLPLAVGEQVRVFNRIIVERQHFASNGDTISVLHANVNGLKARNDDGREAFICWDQLRERRHAPVMLAYGYAVTIDTAQGITSDEHINAMVDGTRGVDARKAYPAESRNRDTTWMVINEATERRQIASRIPIGEFRPISQDAIWANVASNLGRQNVRDNALDFLRVGSSIQRGTTMAVAAALESAERRERAGVEPVTIRHRLERMAVERSSTLHQVVQHARRLQQHIREIAPRIQHVVRGGPSLRL